MSRKEQILKNLIVEKKLSDKQLSKILEVPTQKIQQSIYWINVNKKKFKEFSIIRYGNKKNYSRELVNKDSNENDLINSADEDGKKALRKLDSRRKKIKISLNTREGQKNRVRLIENLLKQNLDLSVETQKLLQ